MHPYTCWVFNRNVDGLKSDPSPSIFGALPCSTQTRESGVRVVGSLATYTFIPRPCHGISSNCSVFHQNQVRFCVKTDLSMPNYTSVTRDDGSNIALVEWGPEPSVEIRGIVAKRPASKFLRHSSNERLRFWIMEVDGVDYIWIPNQNDGYTLYKAGENLMFAKTTSKCTAVVLHVVEHLLI
ncbi:hypothetical protein E1B28_002219 [Marasmius oreades]|uniref:Uncharacterized protein n=1 Tax=Marasmius oreades TaxID=181124 RepID=A0A9P7RMK7_9AGAR|nr:uncharacterized protein E1B28_002219 [Marasmius oreades]KAG7086250.1 hypothetical protein E1B28_002219 [Marasmius oreades]